MNIDYRCSLERTIILVETKKRVEYFEKIDEHIRKQFFVAMSAILLRRTFKLGASLL